MRKRPTSTHRYYRCCRSRRRCCRVNRPYTKQHKIKLAARDEWIKKPLSQIANIHAREYLTRARQNTVKTRQNRVLAPKSTQWLYSIVWVCAVWVWAREHRAQSTLPTVTITIAMAKSVKVYTPHNAQRTHTLDVCAMQCRVHSVCLFGVWNVVEIPVALCLVGFQYDTIWVYGTV